MFDEDRKFNFFDYQHLTKDFCFMKPITMYFESRSKHSLCSIEQVVEVKNSKCTFEENINVQKWFGKAHLFRMATGSNSLKFYYQFLLPRKNHNQTANIETQGNSTQKQKESSQASEEKSNSSLSDSSVYTTVYSDKKLQNASFQLGFNKKSQKFLLNANLSSFLNIHKNQYFIYSKFIYLSNRYNFGLLSIFDLGSHNLQTNNLVLQLKPNEKHQLFLRAEVDGLRNYSLNYSKIKNYFDFLYANYIVKPTQSLTLMAQLKYDIQNKKVKYVQSLVQKCFPNRKLRFKVSNAPDITFQYQFPIFVNKQSNMDFSIRFSEFFKNTKINYGVRINLNY